MKGNTQVIHYLNQVLSNELNAINQYFLHARLLQNLGFNKLGEHEYNESIDEMKHADQLIQRILFLDGMPNLQNVGKPLIGKDVKSMLENDLQFERQAMAVLQAGIHCAEAEKDFGSRDLFHAILLSEEKHIDWLETQLKLIEQLGLASYLQMQM